MWPDSRVGRLHTSMNQPNVPKQTIDRPTRVERTCLPIPLWTKLGHRQTVHLVRKGSDLKGHAWASTQENRTRLVLLCQSCSIFDLGAQSPPSTHPHRYPSEPVQPSVVCTAECVAIHHGVRCEAQHKFHNDQSTPGLQFAVWQCIGGWTKTSQPGQALQIACWLQCGVNSNCWTDRDQGLCECEI